MVTPRVTVAIPVGPHSSHQRWLGEAIDSVRDQTLIPKILLIDDMAGLPVDYDKEGDPYPIGFVHKADYIWRAPWRLGVAHAFNAGVALSDTELVILLGADDTLEPTAVEEAATLVASDGPELAAETYYFFNVRYMDTGEVQTQPCGAAAVTRRFWQNTGGFPPESASGAPDAAFLSQIWNSTVFGIKPITREPLYNYRRHGETDTASRAAWQGVILTTRDLLTQEFPNRKPWGRYEP